MTAAYRRYRLEAWSRMRQERRLMRVKIACLLFGDYWQALGWRGVVVGFWNKRATIARLVTQPAFGLVVIVSFLLAISPATMTPAQSSPAHHDDCKLQAAAIDVVLAHPDCGPSSSHVGCVVHSGCLAFTLPTQNLGSASFGSRQWPLLMHDDGAGWIVLLGTPPPKAV